MSSKPDSPTRSCFHLPSVSLLAFDGPDASAFAQAQFCNDVAALRVGSWQWNAWLSPKGRVIALFRLVRVADTRLLAVLEDVAASTLAERLVRYRFRSRVAIEAVDALALGCWLPAADADSVTVHGDLETKLELRLDAHRALRLQRASAADPTIASEDAEAQARWRLADVRAGIPHLQADDVEAFTAHMLGLDALGALSLHKGCYPGHEIVARSHYLGQVKRGLRRVAADAPLPARAPLLDDAGQAVGHLVCSANLPPDTFEGLAVLPREETTTQRSILLDRTTVRVL